MTTAPPPVIETGRGTAVLVYVLYLLSIPSAAVFAVIGVIIALTGKEGAGPLARAHLEHQVRIWFTAFWWVIVLMVVSLVGVILSFILIGIPILWLVAIGFLIIQIWFTIVSLLGLIALLNNQPR